MLILFEYRGVLQCAAMSFANTKLDGANGRALAPLSDGAKSMPPRYYSHVNEKSDVVCIIHSFIHGRLQAIQNEASKQA